MSETFDIAGGTTMQESNETLAVRIQTGERDLLPLLWEQTQAFVRQQANRWARAWQQSRPDVTAEDLYQTGYIALCEAVETFQEGKESSFVNWLAFYLKTEFSQEIGCRTDKQIRDPLGHAVSLDAPIGGDTEALTLGDTVRDPNDPYEVIERDLYRQQIRTVVRLALDEVPSTERNTLLFRYFEDKTLKETAVIVGVYPSTIQQRELKALRYLRKSKHIAALREAWYGELNPYRGTTLAAWKNTGCSVQEMAVIKQEQYTNSDDPW